MRVIRGLLIFLLVSALLLLGIVALVLETSPSLDVSASEQVADADTVHSLLEQIESSIEDRHEGHIITISEPQLLSLVGVVQRAQASFIGDVDIDPEGTRVQFSIALPTYIPLYLNIDSTLLPANKFVIQHLTIGDLHIPGDMAVSVVEWMVNRWTKSDIATQARQQVSEVSMTTSELHVTLLPMNDFLKQLNGMKNGIRVDQNDELRELTAYYLRYISWQDLSIAETSQPAVDYIRHTFKRVQEQSTPETAVKHNQAAIMALAIFIGHHRVANFVGDVQPDAERALKPAKPPLLRERADLTKHFTISAALKVVSEQGVSLAIGEFKELMDRAVGGSGYSFVDLTADMSGVKLAEVATNPQTAVFAQQYLANITSDDDIIPSIEGIIEGISKEEFVEQFKEVDSEAYLQEVNKIKARLATIPLYQEQ